MCEHCEETETENWLLKQRSETYRLKFNRVNGELKVKEGQLVETRHERDKLLNDLNLKKKRPLQKKDNDETALLKAQLEAANERAMDALALVVKTERKKEAADKQCAELRHLNTILLARASQQQVHMVGLECGFQSLQQRIKEYQGLLKRIMAASPEMGAQLLEIINEYAQKT